MTNHMGSETGGREKPSWKPRRWLVKELNHRCRGKPLHEILSSDEGVSLLPSVNVSRISREWVSAGQGLPKIIYPVVRLNPPLDNILVIACPNCGAPLRGYGGGAGVICDECAFPMHDVAQRAEEKNEP